VNEPSQPLEPSLSPERSGPRETAGRRARARWSAFELAVVAAAVVPVITAVLRRRGDRWIPIGDNALIELRARDVFSLRHFPFLGTWSSASLSAGTDLNHPGPLLFDLLAVPVRVFGGSTGVALGVGLINAAAIVGVALVARRVCGTAGLVVGSLVASLLAYTLGSGMLTDPWNPHVLVLPALLVLVSAWAVAAGDVAMAPVLLAAGSLCLQTHLGYAYLVPALVLVAVAGAGVVYRRRWRLDAATRPGDRRLMARTAAWSVVTVAVLWWQPLAEQFFGEGKGNMARILSSTGGDEPAIGARTAIRIVGGLLALDPWWGRDSFVDAVPFTPYAADGVTLEPIGLASLGAALAALVVLASLLAVVGRWSWRRRDRPGVVAVALAGVAVVLAVGSITVMPVGPLGLTPHQMRWLWSIGAFTVMALLLAARPLAARPLAADGAVADDAVARRSAPPVVVGLAVVTAVVAALNVPAFQQPAGPDTFAESIPVARAISDQVRAYRTDSAVVLDDTNLRYLEPYSAVVMAALQQAGVDLRVADSGLVRQLGNARRADGDEPLTVFLLEGRDALEVPEGSERIAFSSPLDAGRIGELLEGEREMVAEVAAFGVVLSDEGRALVAAGAFGLDEQQIVDASFDPEQFVRGGLAAELVAAGALALDPIVAERFVRTSELRRQVGTTTVAVLVRPSAGA
jgi:hypothetical protein